MLFPFALHFSSFLPHLPMQENCQQLLPTSRPSRLRLSTETCSTSRSSTPTQNRPPISRCGSLPLKFLARGGRGLAWWRGEELAEGESKDSPIGIVRTLTPALPPHLRRGYLFVHVWLFGCVQGNCPSRTRSSFFRPRDSKSLGIHTEAGNGTAAVSVSGFVIVYGSLRVLLAYLSRVGMCMCFFCQD